MLGAEILIKSSLLYTSSPSIQENFLQSAIISIKLNHVPITRAVTYCPDKHKITPTQYEQLFHSLSHYYKVDGDLNAKN